MYTRCHDGCARVIKCERKSNKERSRTDGRKKFKDKKKLLSKDDSEVQWRGNNALCKSYYNNYCTPKVDVNYGTRQKKVSAWFTICR